MVGLLSETKMNKLFRTLNYFSGWVVCKWIQTVNANGRKPPSHPTNGKTNATAEGNPKEPVKAAVELPYNETLRDYNHRVVNVYTVYTMPERYTFEEPVGRRQQGRLVGPSSQYGDRRFSRGFSFFSRVLISICLDHKPTELSFQRYIQIFVSLVLGK